MNIYYVYFYLRSKDSKTAKAGTPYYVGKGKKKRALQKHENIPVPKDKSKIIIVEQELTELQAFILERYYIRWFGRKDLGTGILRNRAEGGEGSSSEDAKRNALKMVKNGKHNFLKKIDGNSIGKTISDKRLVDNTHNFQNHKGTIPCIDKSGKFVRVEKEQYYSQTESPENREWVFNTSKEGLKRKGKTCKSTKTLIPCYDKQGKYVYITKETYDNQVGEIASWDYVTIRSFEGKMRNRNK